MRYIIIITLILLDQITKYLAVVGLKDRKGVEIVQGVLRFDYVENTGAAFGIMRNALWMFIGVTIIFVILAFIYYEKKVKQQKNKMYNIIYILIIAGAVGNLIDRIVNRYVVDFINFYIINYPLFNLADSFVCVGCMLLGLMLIKETGHQEEVKGSGK